MREFEDSNQLGQKDILSLKGENSQLKNEIEFLKSQISQMESTIDSLNGTIRDKDQEMDQVEDSRAELKVDIEDLNNNLQL